MLIKELCIMAAISTGISASSYASQDMEVSAASLEDQALLEGDIVEIAKSTGSFNTLLTALSVADLKEVLMGEGPFTVFAPTDEAFAKIPQEALNALLADKEALKKVLLYHVVPGSLDASAVLGSDTLESANQLSLDVNLREGVPYINDSQITATNVVARNGVIHVIDTVLMP